MFQYAMPRLRNESFTANIRKMWRHGLRTLGSGGATLGSYALVPLDHHAVLSTTEPGFVYGNVLERIVMQGDVYESLLRRMRAPMAVAKATIETNRIDERQPYWSNTYFQGNDAGVAWALTGLMQPARIVEIGSGNSTKFFRRSIDDHALDTRLVCIDPAPRTEISAVADEIHSTTVQRVSDNVFSALKPGDFLFFDGSHLVMQGADTQFVFLEILPRLPKGVIVHIHDVNLPYEYRRFYDGRFYGEQYMLAALLVFSPDWKPVLPVYWLEKNGWLDAFGNPGASFWLTNDLKFLLGRAAASG
jgi:hypothetical protein